MGDAWTTEEKYTIVANIVLLVGLVAILNWALNHGSFWWVAIGAGGLGGLIHELAQSKGKILFIKKYDDGVYLGSISGIILGLVAGILMLQNQITSDQTIETAKLTKATFDAFIAGLALKGVVDATSSEPVPQPVKK